jgi:hypothetical protein
MMTAALGWCHAAAGTVGPILSSLSVAVERRLGEKRAGQLQDVIGPAEFSNLTLQRLHALPLGRDGPQGFVVESKTTCAVLRSISRLANVSQ